MSHDIDAMLAEIQYIRKSIQDNRAVAEHHLERSRSATADARRMLSQLQQES
jgi:hypothetical protein